MEARRRDCARRREARPAPAMRMGFRVAVEAMIMVLLYGDVGREGKQSRPISECNVQIFKRLESPIHLSLTNYQ